jgi:hypothetical protein
MDYIAAAIFLCALAFVVLRVAWVRRKQPPIDSHLLTGFDGPGVQEPKGASEPIASQRAEAAFEDTRRVTGQQPDAAEESQWWYFNGPHTRITKAVRISYAPRTTGDLHPVIHGLMAVVLSLAMGAASLYIILGSFPDSTQKWAFATIGGLFGHWVTSKK